MKIDFTNVVDSIFKNKNQYSKLTDEDKRKFFWIINRKFGVRYIKQSQFLNTRFIDKESCMDIWYLFFKNARAIPSWYWAKSKKKIKNSKIPSSDRKLLLENTNLNDNDIEFMIEYYIDDLQYEIKKLKRLE